MTENAITNLIVRIDERTSQLVKNVDSIQVDLNLIRQAHVENGKAIEGIRQSCIERHRRISRDIESLTSANKNDLDFVTRTKASWKTLAVLGGVFMGLFTIGYQLWNFYKAIGK